MSKSLLSLMFLLACFSPVKGQEKPAPCLCRENSITRVIQPDTVFRLPNGTEIVLCGYHDMLNNQLYFSEFVLYECGADSLMGEWGATQNCIVKTEQNKVYVMSMVNLPTGTGRSYQMTPWKISIFFPKPLGHFYRSDKISGQHQNYSPAEIKLTISEYHQASSKWDEKNMQIVNRLFVASISGSIEARNLFTSCTKRFGHPDGAFAEELNDLNHMLYQWDHLPKILRF